MSATRRHRPSVAFPVLIVAAGVVLLFGNLNLLPAGAWSRFLEASPLILVIVGVSILVRAAAPGDLGGWAAQAAAIVLGLVGFVYVALGPPLGAGNYASFSSSSPRGGETAATLTVNAAASEFTIDTGDLGSFAYQAKVDYVGSAPSVSYDAGNLVMSSNQSGTIQTGSRPDRFDVTLAASIPWTVVINGAGVTAHLDFKGGQLAAFTVNGVGTSSQISLGAPSGSVALTVSGVGASLSATVPAGTEYRCDAAGIGATAQGTQETPGWSTAQDRYDFEARGVATRVQVVEEASSAGVSSAV